MIIRKKMFNKLTWCFIFIMFLTAVVSGQDKTYKLADFEDAKSNELWLKMKSPRANWRVAEISISQQFKSNGKNSLKAVFKKYKSGVKPFVMLEPNIDNRALSINDWTPYRRLLIDIYNPSKKNSSLAVRISDPRFKINFWKKYSFKPGWNTIVILMSDLAKRRLNLSKITKLKFYAVRPRKDIVLYFDNFRFSKKPGRSCSSTAKASSKSAVKTKSLNKTISAVASEAGKTYKLTDFEDSISNKFWLKMKTAKDDCRVAETSISQKFKSNGANSLKVVFTKHKRGAKPYVIFEPNIDNRALCINDWAPYRRLLIDVYNPMKKKTGLRMLISDPAFKRNFWNKYSFKPGWNTIIIPISDLAKRGLNLAKITKLKFYTPRPREDIVLYFDNFRFSKESGSPWASAASALSSSIVKMESLNKTLSAGVNKAKLIENNIKSQKGKYDDLLNEMKLIRNNICDKSIFAVASTGIPESQCTGIKQTGLSYARGIEITNLEYFSDKLKNILAEKKLLEQITENKSNADFVIGEIKYPDVDNIRYSPRTYSGSLINTVSVSACKNETRSACLLVIPHQKALKNLQLKAKELKSRSFKSVIPANNIKICPVAYRKDNFQNAAFAYLLRPDIAKVDIPVNAQQAFWLNIKVPDNIPAGNYSGQIVVSADGIKPQNIGINLHVYNFTLPAKPSLPVIVHSNSSPTVAADALDIMEHRCEPGSIYTWRNVPTIERIKLWVKNGAQMIPLLRISTQGRNIWKRDANGKVIDFADSRKAAILRKLRAIIPKIKKAGLLDKCYVYGFDEPSPAWLPAMEKVYSELKKEFGIKTMFATYQPLWEYQDIKNADYWAVAWGLLTPERIKRFHKKNIKLFSYNLATQGQRGKLQFWSAFKSGVDGLLHYKLNSANDEAPKTDFPIVNAKLGSVRMPDRAGKKNYNTISFEMWREGSEDYEYLYLLRKNIKLLEKNPTLAKNNAELLFKAKATLFSVNETIPSIDKYYSSYNDISLNTICELRNRVAKIIEKLEYVLNNKNQE